MLQEGKYESLIFLNEYLCLSIHGSVPAMVADLTDSSLVGHPLEGLLFGGSPAPDSLVPRARKAFPTAVMCVPPLSPKYAQC